MTILGVDPGLAGAFVFLSGATAVMHEMPIIKIGDNKEIDFNKVRELLMMNDIDHIFIERAMPLAMGSKHAFNYGRGFAALEIAIALSELPVTYVLPKTWCKVMHDGISEDLKPKAKSLIAVKRLMMKQLKNIPKSKKGKYHDGGIDALLIAGYGQRVLKCFTLVKAYENMNT